MNTLLVAVLALILATIFQPVHGAIPDGPISPRQGSLIILTDESGSMTQTDPNNLRHDAANLILDLSLDGQMVAAGFFSTSAPTDADLRPRPLNDHLRRELQTRLANQRLGDRTALLYSISKTATISLEERSKGRFSNILLMTDGGENVITDEHDKAATKELFYHKLKASGAHVTTVGLGTDVSQEMLTEIALRTHGAYYPAKTADALLSIYRWYVVETLRMALYEGSEITLPFPVRNATALVLKEPQQTGVLQGLQSDSCRIDAKSFEVYVSTAGKYYELLRVPQLAAGHWQVLTKGQMPRISWVVEMPVTLEIVEPKEGKADAGVPFKLITRFVPNDQRSPIDFGPFLSSVTVSATIVDPITGKSQSYALSQLPNDKSMFEVSIDAHAAGVYELGAIGNYIMPNVPDPFRLRSSRLIEVVEPQLRLRFARQQLDLGSPLASTDAIVEIDHQSPSNTIASIEAAAEFWFGISFKSGSEARPERKVSATDLGNLKIDAADKLLPGDYVVSIRGVHPTARIAPAHASLHVNPYAPAKSPIALFRKAGEIKLGSPLSLEFEILRPLDHAPINVGDPIDQDRIWMFDGLSDATLVMKGPIDEMRVDAMRPDQTQRSASGTTQIELPLKYPGSHTITLAGHAKVRNIITRQPGANLPLDSRPDQMEITVPDHIVLDQSVIELSLGSNETEVQFSVSGNAMLQSIRVLAVAGGDEALAQVDPGEPTLTLPSMWIKSMTDTIQPSTLECGSHPFRVSAKILPHLDTVELHPGLYTTELLLVDTAINCTTAEAILGRVALRLLVESRRPRPSMFTVSHNLPRELDPVTGYLDVFEGPTPPDQQAVTSPSQIVVYSIPDQREVKVGDLVLNGKYRIQSIRFCLLNPTAARKVATLQDGNRSTFQSIYISGTDEIPIGLGVDEIVFEPPTPDGTSISIAIGTTEWFTILPRSN